MDLSVSIGVEKEKRLLLVGRSSRSVFGIGLWITSRSIGLHLAVRSVFGIRLHLAVLLRSVFFHLAVLLIGLSSALNWITSSSALSGNSEPDQ